MATRPRSELRPGLEEPLPWMIGSTGRGFLGGRNRLLAAFQRGYTMFLFPKELCHDFGTQEGWLSEHLSILKVSPRSSRESLWGRPSKSGNSQAKPLFLEVSGSSSFRAWKVRGPAFYTLNARLGAGASFDRVGCYKSFERKSTLISTFPEKSRKCGHVQGEPELGSQSPGPAMMIRV